MEIPKQPRPMLAKACTLQTDRRLYCQRQLTQFIEHGAIELVSAWSLHPCILVLWYRKVLCKLLKEKPGHQE